MYANYQIKKYLKYKNYLRYKRTDLILQPEKFTQSLLHHTWKGEKTEGVACGGSVKYHHGEIHPLHKPIKHTQNTYLKLMDK